MRAVHAGGVRLGRPRVAIGILSAAVLACQPAPSGPVSVPLADAASARVYTVQTTTAQDWTGHIPLTEGSTVRLQVRLYTASGREIVPPANPVGLSFSFAPGTLASATVADSALRTFDLTPTDPPESDGGMTIRLTEAETGTTKSFGPFYILVHPAQ